MPAGRYGGQTSLHRERVVASGLGLRWQSHRRRGRQARTTFQREVNNLREGLLGSGWIAPDSPRCSIRFRTKCPMAVMRAHRARRRANGAEREGRSFQRQSRSKCSFLVWADYRWTRRMLLEQAKRSARKWPRHANDVAARNAAAARSTTAAGKATRRNWGDDSSCVKPDHNPNAMPEATAIAIATAGSRITCAVTG